MIVLPFSSREEIDAALRPALAHLRAGGLFAYPTETVYGLGCALHEEALARLARLKRADTGKPFLLLTAGAAMLPGLHWTAAAEQLAQRFWPGPLTLVLRAGTGAFPPHVTGAGGAVAVRDTSHAGVRALIDGLGGPVTSTSANAPGAAPAADAAGALRALRALGAAADSLVLDGGALPASESSTLVDCTRPLPRVLRAGALRVEQIAEVVEVSDE